MKIRNTMEEIRMTLDEAVRCCMKDTREQKEYDKKEEQWMNQERD